MISVSIVIPFGILGATSVVKPLLGMVNRGTSVLLGGIYGGNKFLASNSSCSSWLGDVVVAFSFLFFFIAWFPFEDGVNLGSCILHSEGRSRT